MRCVICKTPSESGLCDRHARIHGLIRQRLWTADLPPKRHWPRCVRCRAVMEAYLFLHGYAAYRCPNFCKFQKQPEKKKLAVVISIR